MAEAKSILSAVITTDSRLSSLPLKESQLIFVKDTKIIALDFNGIRTIYSQIIKISNEVERESILAPVYGSYYFVEDSLCLWYYDGKWEQITSPPSDILYELKNTTDLPSIGKALCLYVITSENKLYRWDDTDIKYYCVGSDYNDIKTINGGSA